MSGFAQQGHIFQGLGYMQEAELQSVMDDLLAAAQTEADGPHLPACTAKSGVQIRQDDPLI